jgi:hypothetical protein
MGLTPEQLAKIQAGSQNRLAAFASGNLSRIFPRKDDELDVRFVPDREFEIVRPLDEHKNVLDDNLKKLPSFLCIGEECELCADIGEQGGLRSEYQFFQWTDSKRALCYVFVLDYQGSNQYVNTKAHALLVGPGTLGKAILDITKNLKTEEELRGFWEPEHPGTVFSVRFKDRGRVEIEPRNKSMTVPPLPKSWPALKGAYIAEGSVPEPEVVKAYRLGFKSWAQRRINVKPIPAVGGESVVTESGHSPEVATAAENEDLVATPVAAAGDVCPPTNCPSEFGQRPQRFVSACLTCPVHAECAGSSIPEDGNFGGEPDDAYLGEPHGDCPAMFGCMPFPLADTCRSCDAGWDCERMTDAWRHKKSRAAGE